MPLLFYSWEFGRINFYIQINHAGFLHELERRFQWEDMRLAMELLASWPLNILFFLYTSPILYAAPLRGLFSFFNFISYSQSLLSIVCY